MRDTDLDEQAPREFNKEQLKTIELLKKITLPCLECGKEYEFDESSNEAQGVFNVFCPGGECEDKYAFKQ